MGKREELERNLEKAEFELGCWIQDSFNEDPEETERGIIDAEKNLWWAREDLKDYLSIQAKRTQHVHNWMKKVRGI